MSRTIQHKRRQQRFGRATLGGRGYVPERHEPPGSVSAPTSPGGTAGADGRRARSPVSRSRRGARPAGVASGVASTAGGGAPRGRARTALSDRGGALVGWASRQARTLWATAGPSARAAGGTRARSEQQPEAQRQARACSARCDCDLRVRSPGAASRTQQFEALPPRGVLGSGVFSSLLAAWCRSTAWFRARGGAMVAHSYPEPSGTEERAQ